MKLNWVKCLVALAILAAIGIATPMRAQDKAAPGAEVKKAQTTIKVGVVVTELDGTKKVSSLPYTFYVNTDETPRVQTSVRVGLRVPIATGTNSANAPASIQYMDIGTNLDCTAYSTPDGRYKLVLSVERSYLSSTEDKKSQALAGESLNISAGNPIIQRFSSSYSLVIRDGQTIEATSTTDPVSGRVLLISVTANAVK
jgi:hypothetical protein